jgi:hypothetical protein
MQNRSSDRPSPKSYTSVQSYKRNALKDAAELAENALIQDPAMPAVQLAEMLFQETEPELLSELSGILIRDFYARARCERPLKRSRGSPFGGFSYWSSFSQLPQDLKGDLPHNLIFR